MRLQQFFSWLLITDLALQHAEDVKAMLGQVVHELPDCQRFDVLAEVLEDYLEDPYFAPSQLNSLLTRFCNIIPKTANESTHEDSIDRIASDLTEEDLQSENLRRFEAILLALDQNGSPGRRHAIELELAELEAHFRTVWNDYQFTPLSPLEVTAEAVLGHRRLEEAFAFWFSALHHASHGQARQAWQEACWGTRLLLAVSRWSGESGLTSRLAAYS